MSLSLGAELRGFQPGRLPLSQHCICLLELAFQCQPIVVNVSLTWQLSAGTRPICHLVCCWIHLQKALSIINWRQSDWQSCMAVGQKWWKLTLSYVTFFGQQSSRWNNRGWHDIDVGHQEYSWYLFSQWGEERWVLIRINLTDCVCVCYRSRAKVNHFVFTCLVHTSICVYNADWLNLCISVNKQLIWAVRKYHTVDLKSN